MATGTVPISGAKLLWTNSSASSDFAAQTVPLDLTPFKLIVVVFKFTKSGTVFFSSVVPVGTTTCYPTYTDCTTGANTSTVVRRSVTAYTTGVTFGAGNNKTLPNGTRSESNDVMIPSQIYGIA